MMPERSLVAVWTVSPAALMVTASDTCPTSMRSSPTVIVSLGLLVMLRFSNFLKPSCSAFNVYVPGATALNEKLPEASEAEARARPVPSETSESFTPGIRLPLESAMLPTIEPVTS